MKPACKSSSVVETTLVQPFYIATERFDAASDGWVAYCEWAEIPNLEELVSLDGMLCPPVFQFGTPEDWENSIQVGRWIEYGDLEPLLERAKGIARRNILAVYRNEERMVGMVPTQKPFEFIGFDLLDDETRISALVNCGGFPESFANAELNRFGLLGSYSRAVEVRVNLSKNNPLEAHAQCQLYEVWRMVDNETRKGENNTGVT